MSLPSDPEGILLLDKPSGITSHDVVDRVRRRLRLKRVGHAGTLDPMATGVLVLLVGKATRVSQFLMGLDKTYEGTARLGVTTDSQDADGEVLTERPLPAGLDLARLREAAAKFRGDQYQTPPMYSAKKIDGVPLYKLARKGQEVEREPRFIRVSSYEILGFTPPDFTFRVACSKGTYVRTLAHDLGEVLGCGAHLTALRRTAVERFRIADCLPLDAWEALPNDEIRRRLVPVADAVPGTLR